MTKKNKFKICRVLIFKKYAKQNRHISITSNISETGISYALVGYLCGFLKTIYKKITTSKSYIVIFTIHNNMLIWLQVNWGCDGRQSGPRLVLVDRIFAHSVQKTWLRLWRFTLTRRVCLHDIIDVIASKQLLAVNRASHYTGCPAEIYTQR